MLLRLDTRHTTKKILVAKPGEVAGTPAVSTPGVRTGKEIIHGTASLDATQACSAHLNHHVSGHRAGETVYSGHGM